VHIPLTYIQVFSNINYATTAKHFISPMYHAICEEIMQRNQIPANPSQMTEYTLACTLTREIASIILSSSSGSPPSKESQW